MSNEFGYIGTAKPTQAVLSNSGVFSVNEHKELIEDEKILSFGQLELIQTQTISSGATMAFTSIKEIEYDVHFMTGNNLLTTNANTGIIIRLSSDGGSSYAAGTTYEKAGQYGGTIANGESVSTGTSGLPFTSDTANQTKVANTYLYDLGDSTKYSFQNFHSQENNYYFWGIGCHDTASSINAIQLTTNNGNDWTGTVALYGLKAYK